MQLCRRFAPTSGLLLGLFALPLGCGGETEPAVVRSPDGRYLAVVRDDTALGDAERSGARVLSSLDARSHVLAIPDEKLAAVAAHIGWLEPDARRYPSGQAMPYGVSQTTALELPPLIPGAPRTKVCVVDSGLEPHPDLPTDSSGAADGGAGPFYVDGCGHGSHVAGTIAALDNDQGVVGVSADGVSLHVVRVFADDCKWAYASGLILAVNECVKAGARVINLSLGGPDESLLERMAFDQLEADGVLTVAAAGNDGTTALHFPASYDSVLSVSAIDASKQVADFSQQNAKVELAAAGVGVLSTVHGGYQAWSGTSMAAPHVSGSAAALMSRNFAWSAAQIREAFAATALDLGDPGRDVAFGHGLVQARQAFDWLMAPPPCVPSASTEVVCNDGIDDDCDGAWDAADDDCATTTCQARATPCSSDEQCCTKRCISDPVYDYCL
ncbi:MAG: S8 family peptidase [Polyangiaceae bacterium]